MTLRDLLDDRWCNGATAALLLCAVLFGLKLAVRLRGAKCAGRRWRGPKDWTP